MFRWAPNGVLWVVKKTKNKTDSGQVHAKPLMVFTFYAEKKKLVSICDKAIGSCSFPLGRLGNQCRDKHV